MRPSAGGGPSVLAFAADAGAFAALGGQHVGVAGVGITPAQVRLQPPGQRGVVRVVRVAHDEGPQGTEVRLDRVGPRRVRRRERSSTFSRFAQRRIAGVLFADRLSMITNNR